tara:strand:+ start:1316 stop:1834 length:519 start_codon:yes stop_codon:yes gene_type:complete
MRFFIILVLFFFKFNLAFSGEKIAFIDLNYIMNNSVSGKSINNFINDIKNNKANELKDIETKIKNDENDLISKKNIIDENMYNSKVEEIRKRIKNYKTEREKFNKSIKENKIKYTNKLLEKINPIISDYVEKNSITIVLPKKMIIIGKKNLDITLPILKILDKSVEKIKFNE